jgi:hypothetical protein
MSAAPVITSPAPGRPTPAEGMPERPERDSYNCSTKAIIARESRPNLSGESTDPSAHDGADVRGIGAGKRRTCGKYFAHRCDLACFASTGLTASLS